MIRLVIESLVVNVNPASEDRPDEDAKEGERCHEGRPLPDLVEDDGDPAKLHVETTVAEARIECDQEADGREEELNGPHEELSRELLHADIPLFEFGVQCPVSGVMTELTRLVHQQ